MGFPGGSAGKESACNVGDQGSIPGLGRSPGEGNVYPLQYSGLENSMDRGAPRATVHGVTKIQTQLSTHLLTYIHGDKRDRRGLQGAVDTKAGKGKEKKRDIAEGEISCEQR